MIRTFGVYSTIVKVAMVERILEIKQAKDFKVV